MFRLLSLAALIGVAWALFRRQPKGQEAAGIMSEAKKTRTRIVIGGNAGAPVITRLPERLVAARGDELVWDVQNDTGAAQEISLEKFTRAGRPSKEPPLAKSDVERRVKAESTAAIRDQVHPRAEAGSYKYSIWVNGKEAVDPEVLIKEEN
jgi:hypothetical protein